MQHYFGWGGMKNRYLIAILPVLLASCSAAKDETTAQDLIAKVEPNDTAKSAPQNKFGFAEALEAKPHLFGSATPPARIQVAMESKDATAASSRAVQNGNSTPQHQIAYSYGFGFRIGRDKIADLQKAHTAVCQAMGPKCRILRTSQGNSDWDGYGEVKLEVAALEAGAFEKPLAEPAKRLGGELVSSVRDGEDLSENIVDSEAKLQSRLLLREKLTAILRNNKGTVADLIAAEKAVADVNEEIDATRSKLEQYRNRIQYSSVSIEYQPEFGQSQLGFSRPVMTAFRSIGTTLGTTTAVLIYLVTALIPITLLILALRWVLHRFGLRIRFSRKAQPATRVNSAEGIS